jgi:hypothetical protein
VLDHIQRHLELQQHHVDGVQPRRPEVADRYGVVRSGDDDDGVLAVRSHRDEGRAGPPTRHLSHTGDVDTAGGEPGEVRRAVVVVAHAADQPHPGAGRCSSDGLVRSLAAGEPAQAGAEDGLARSGMGRHRDDQVDVDRPHDKDPAGHGPTAARNRSR